MIWNTIRRYAWLGCCMSVGWLFLGQVIRAQEGSLGSTATLNEITKPAATNTSDGPAARRLTLHPAAEPQPALRYRFWPTYLEQYADSAQMRFLRINSQISEMTSDVRKDIGEAITDIGEGVRFTVVDFLQIEQRVPEHVWNEIERMALSDDTRFNLQLRRLHGTQAYLEPLTEVNMSREIGRLIELRARRQLLQGDWDGFCRSVGHGFRLAHLIGNGETLVQQLVGLAIAGRMLELVEVAMQTPQSPNFYWALATLPRPLIEMRRAMEIEQEWIFMVFPLLEHPETLQLSDDEWRRQWNEGMQAIRMLTSPTMRENAGISLVLDAASGSAARTRLTQRGYSVADVDKMNVYQRLAIDTALQVREQRDAYYKFHLLPFPESQVVAGEAQQQFDRWTQENRNQSSAAMILGSLLPGFHSVERSHIRHQCLMQRLMTIEALRLHAAVHGGSLPTQISELRPVPALPNPATGQPWSYSIAASGSESVVSLISPVALRGDDDDVQRIDLVFPAK